MRTLAAALLSPVDFSSSIACLYSVVYPFCLALTVTY